MADTPQISNSLENKTILIVEDDNFISRVYTKWLTLRGARVISAANGALGLRMLETEKVDLILLDLGMPGMDGYQTVKLLKNTEHTQEIPVIILSNTSVAENKAGFLELKSMGVTSILQKYETSLSEIVEHIVSHLKDQQANSGVTKN